MWISQIATLVVMGIFAWGVTELFLYSLSEKINKNG